jgi:UDP-N-acetylmuramoylalanine--D-glutamate ligase
VKPRPPLPPGPYLVVGLARSGTAAARLLAGYGETIGCDIGDPPEAAGLSGLEVHLRSDGLELLQRARTVVKSPGVPDGAPVVVAARERGLEVTGELEVAWRLSRNDFVAVTGTNGKTTTVELLGAIHREAGLAAVVAGNVGTPLASVVADLDPATLVVCEASSFQLEDSAAFAPECAVLLNLTDDHLDRHRTAEAYRAAKMAIFAGQEPGDLAVLPRGFGPVPGEATRVSFGGDGPGLAHRDGALWWRGTRLIDTDDVRLRGAHNLENAMAAATAALARGVDASAVSRTLATFAGVRHRLEEVAEHGGVLFVNDSKATNVASASVGIEAFEDGVHAILGGSLKGGGFAGLRGAVASRCCACYLIGEASERLAGDLEGTVPLRRCGDLERAVAAASRQARPGEVILLSPACASYDQYASFEQRGDHFRALVTGMKATAGQGETGSTAASGA